MSQKGHSAIILLVGLALIIGAGYWLGFLGNKIVQPEAPVYEQQLPPDPSRGRGVVYDSGSTVGEFGFSLTYPEGWRVYQKFPSDMANRVTFELIPADVLASQGGDVLWGGFNVDVYPPATTIEKWFTEWLKISLTEIDMEFNKRSYFTYTTSKLGNKTGYLIKTSPKAPELLQDSFIPRYVVLGTKNSYQVGFFQNGMEDFSAKIKSDLFPGLKFE